MIKRRPLPVPLLVPLLAWLGGMVLALYIPLSCIWWSLGLSALLCVVALIYRKPRQGLVVVIFVCLGSSWALLNREQPGSLQTLIEDRGETRQEIRFVVRRMLSVEAKTYEIDLYKIGSFRLEEKLLFVSSEKLVSGSHYRTTALIRPLESDPLLDLYPASYSAIAYAKDKIILTYKGTGSGRINALRDHFLGKLDQRLGEDSGLAKALLLSDLNSKRQYRQRLTRGGLIHLVVVSGLHVWFIFGIISVLLGFVPYRSVVYLLSMALIAVFAALNNWSAPITRAVLMIGLMGLAEVLSRPVHPLQILCASLWIISLVAPGQVYSVSLQLSYLSVFVISMGLPRISVAGLRDHLAGRWISRIFKYCMLSLVVGLAILPLSLYYFGSGSLNGVIGNLVAIPLVGLILPLSFILMLAPLGGIWSYFETSYHFLVDLFVNWAEWVSRLPLWIEGRYISQWQALAGLLGVAILLLILRGRWKALRVLALPAVLSILLLIIVPPWISNRELGYYLFNCGNADCMLYQLDAQTSLMIDTGGIYGDYQESDKPDPEQLTRNNWMHHKLLPYLAKKNYRDIDWLVITHMHNDHYGGLAALARALPIRNLVISRYTAANPVFQELKSIGSLAKSRVYVVDDTLSLFMAGARLKVLHPNAEYIDSNENNRSLVCRLDWLGQKHLFTGDIEEEAENWLVEKYPEELDADYLKAPHHGSISSSTQSFVKAVSPSVVIFSSAARSRHRFPHPQVLKRYQQIGAQALHSYDGSRFFELIDGQSD